MKQSEFDQSVKYTVRIELLTGKVLLYGVDATTKNYLRTRLFDNSQGDSGIDAINFVLFQTSGERSVLLNITEILRLTLCFDYLIAGANPHAYYDNFNALEKESESEEFKNINSSKWVDLKEDDFLPQAIIYHKGKAPVDDSYYANPLFYSSLNNGCLADLDEEVEGEFPLRQFINLIDEDGEETFIPVAQIILLEIDNALLSFEEELEEEDDDENKN